MVRLPGRFASQLTTHTTRQINISNQRENEHRTYNATADVVALGLMGFYCLSKSIPLKMKSAHFEHIFINESLFCCR